MEAEIEALKQYGVNIKPDHSSAYKYEGPGFIDRSEQIPVWEVEVATQVGWDLYVVVEACADFETWNNESFLVDVRPGIVQCTFNEPENNNSFSAGITGGLNDMIRILRTGREDIRMATLTGNGRMWSAGGDPRAFQASQRLAGVIGGDKPPPASMNEAYEQSKSRPSMAGGRQERQEEEQAEDSGEQQSQSSAPAAAQLEESYEEVGKKTDGEHELYGGPPGYAIVYNEDTMSGGQKNVRDAIMGAKFFFSWATAPVFTMALMNGSAMGGALGLLAGSDYVVAVKSAFAVLSEVRLGVIPAVVSPHVIRAIGFSNAKRIFATAENLNTAKALEIGLIQRIVTKKDEFPAVVKELTEKLQAVSRHAVQASKAAIFNCLNRPINDSLNSYTTGLYTLVRKMPHCEEGMRCLDENKPMPWEEKIIEPKE